MGCLRYKNVEVTDCNWKSGVACFKRPSATHRQLVGHAKIGITDFRFPFVASRNLALFLLSVLILNGKSFFVFKIIFPY